MRNGLILYAVLFFLHDLCAQKSTYPQSEAHLFYRHFTVRDGLPSNETYFVYQDKAGYIWICTDNGISRFDGVQFQNYNEEEGLCSNVVFGCKEDPKGTLWVYSFTGELYRYLPATDRFECPRFNDSLAHILRGGVILDLVFEKDTIYVLTSVNYVKLCLKANGQADMSLTEANPQTLSSKVLSNGEVVTISSTGGGITRFDFILTHAGNHTTDTIRNIPINGLVDAHVSSLIDKDLFVVFGENFFTYNFRSKQHSIEVLPFSHTPLLRKSGVGILSGSFGKGLWSIRKEDNRFVYRQLLKDKNISGSLEDKQGDIWACSQTDGVYFIPSRAAFSFLTNESDDSRHITALFTIKDHAFYMTYGGALYALSATGPPLQEMLIQPGLYNMRNMKVLNNNEILLTGKRAMCYNIATRRISEISPDEICRRKVLQEPSFAVGHDKLIMRTCDGSSQNEKVLSEDWKFGRVVSRFVGKKGTIWLGTIRDLIFIDTSAHKISEVGKKNGFQKFFAKYILPLGGDSVMVASSQGIFFIVRDEIKKHITRDDGLSSNKVHSLFLSDGVLLAGTSKGIDRLRNFYGPGDPLVSSLTGLTGVPECPVTHFGHIGNYLLAGTYEGVYLFDKTQLFEKAGPISAKITGLTINDSLKIRSLTDHFTLKHDQNSILIRFTALNYRNSLFNKYRYRLKTSDQTGWSLTSMNHVVFPLLFPGTYEFELQAMNPDGNWSSHTARFMLTIKRPFWQTWWFITLLALCAAVVTYVVFQFRIKRLRQVSDLTNKLSEAKMQALGMQLNPHFVFNALNSVSFHMARNDIKATLKILGKFAKLMRFIFRNSQYAIISLEDELKALKLYIELETVRLGTDFSYSIDAEENINVDECKIPTLLLQPFVENAIWHGIGPMNGGGKLDIVFMHIGDTLQIEIIDNGIGREKAALIKPKKIKRLHSLDIIKERLDLLKTKYNADVHMELDDAYQDNEYCGTRVLIIIPWLTDEVA